MTDNNGRPHRNHALTVSVVAFVLAGGLLLLLFPVVFGGVGLLRLVFVATIFGVWAGFTPILLNSLRLTPPETLHPIDDPPPDTPTHTQLTELGFRHLSAFDVESDLVRYTIHAYVSERGGVVALVDDALGFDLVDMDAHFPDGRVLEVTTPTGDEVTAEGYYIWRVEPSIGAAYARVQALIGGGSPLIVNTTEDIIKRYRHFEQHVKWHRESGARRYAYIQIAGLVAATLALGFVAALPWTTLLTGSTASGLLRFGPGTSLLLAFAGVIAVGGIMLPIRMLTALNERLNNPESWS